MRKKTLGVLIILLAVGTAASLSFAQSEQITVTTYYPSPYGSYRELRARRVAIGDSYIDTSQYCWGSGCTTVFPGNADLMVEGDVAFGTEAGGAGYHKVDFFNSSGAARFSSWFLGSGAFVIYNGRRDTYAFEYDSGNQRVLIDKTNAGVSVGIGIDPPAAKLDVGGSARIRGLSTGYVCSDADGDLSSGASCSTSSRRYKKDIRDLVLDASDVFKLRPVRFRWKESGQEDVGLIAEEVEETINDLVVYDKEGSPQSVKYDKLAIYLLGVVKQQQGEINNLKKEINNLKKK